MLTDYVHIFSHGSVSHGLRFLATYYIYLPFADHRDI